MLPYVVVEATEAGRFGISTCNLKALLPAYNEIFSLFQPWEDVTNMVNVINQETALILNTIQEGVYGLDKDGKATFVNPAAVRMTGWSAEELIGKNIHEYHHHSRPDGSHYPKEECPIYASVYKGTVHDLDNEVFWRKDGTSFPVEYSSTPIMEDGERVGAVVVFKDITERKQKDEALQNALSEVQRLKERLQAENVYLQEEIRTEHNFSQIIGNSPALRKVLEQVELVAPTETSVLIEGETGTGKELIARAIHDLSPRKQRPLVKVNCGAIPAGLVESELFGHEKGAFTGAHQQHKGRFELADGGTLFLDEVGELPLEVQTKLLRVLQEQEFERVGGRQSIKVNVRVITATHCNLQEMVSEQKFRMDLFYRLSVFPLRVPPLRERAEDIPMLAQHILTTLRNVLRKPLTALTEGSLHRLQTYHWPGNVRELFNVIERAAILSADEYVEVEDVFGPISETSVTPKLLTMAEAEKRYILQVLEYTEGAIAGRKGAAEILNLPPSTLRSRMKKLGI